MTITNDLANWAGTGANSSVLIANGGNIGIGINAPANLLDVQNNLSSQIRVGYVAGGATAYYDFGRDSSDGLFAFNGAQSLYVGYKWKIQGTERMRITAAGELLLGTSTALVSGAGSVSFVGSTTNRCWVNIGRATASTTGVASSITGWNGPTQVCSIDFNANGANNSGLIQTYTWSAGSAVQGPYVTTGGTSWTTASDENLKDIIEPIENGVEKLSSLRSVIGKFKTDHDDVRRVFLIAQDVQAVLPEAIVTDTDGHLGLNYQDMIPLLVKAIQELSAKNQELLAKNGDIEQRLALLEANK